MKKEFSKSWKSSKQPRKQRKYRANAPLHIKRKMLKANLSKSLREKYGKRSVTLRKGDKVKVMRGAYKTKQGKILEVQTKKLRVSIEGITRKKQDGSQAPVYFNPSNLQIIELELSDKKRIESLETKSNKPKGKENAPKETKSS